MASADGKENIADGLIAGPSFKAPSLSPKKTSRKTRSKSIGPGGLGGPEEPALKESTGNRRKSAFVPAVKSILASNDEDEKKRREARRKSLARRRVSFAPEATLHTWDVVEYLRDATTSSASSEATRRASNVSEASVQASHAPDSDAEEPPSTPPEQAEVPEVDLGSSPANQRDLHQKKNRRRSSGIPPMNFNNPDDLLSSSPLSGDNNSSPGGIENSDSEEDENATGKLDASPDAEDSSQSSARLDAALRQAANYAGTQRLGLDEDEDVSMELAEDEITASFKPWAQKSTNISPNEQDTRSPFSPAATEDDFGDEDMSMDITRAVGRIVPQSQSESPDTDDDMSMELTMPLGSIQAVGSKESSNRRKSLKRRVSLPDASQGSPAKRPASRRASLRRRVSSGKEVPEDETMDLTMAIGGIKTQHALEHSQDSAGQSSVNPGFDDMTMDFTVAVGSIKDSTERQLTNTEVYKSDAEDEDLSMEFTKVVGHGIKHFGRQNTTPEKRTAVANLTVQQAKTPTPIKSPKKSPGRPKGSAAKATTHSSPQKVVHATPTKSPGKSRRGLNVNTPEVVLQQRIEDFEPSPFVRSAPQSATKVEAITTPNNEPQRQASVLIPDDPISAPILNRRRSSLSAVQFSPITTARDEPTLKSTALLTNNIKLLSTPRKQTLTSPVKRGITPKKAQTPQKEKTPKQKTPTPKKATPRRSLSPKKRVAFGEEEQAQQDMQDETQEEDAQDVERISLQEFLDMTKIRFMDLSTTKRRHTAAPAAFHDKEIEEKEESLDRYVVAAACTLPEFELFQHACHEMKIYISDGRHFVRSMEANVLEENPLLFSEYLTAPPDQRAIMDTQFKNLKTNARLEARGEWYGWRSTLLQDLKTGLLGTMDGFGRDESILSDQEKLLDKILPPLTEKQERLAVEFKQLQQRHDELNSCDREELEQTRDRLVATDAEIAEKRQLLAQLQQEQADREARIEAARERKVECVEEIKAAERVREECRGWSTSEVNELKAKVTAIEQAHGWSITSASTSSITMTYMNDLELYFQPASFDTGSETLNGSISLAYVGDSAAAHPRPLTTSKRFFLQIIRAHLHCIPQSQTQITELLSLVKDSWETALAVAEGVRWLEHSHVTEEFIRSDELMAVSSNMLLSTLQTKVKITFEVSVSLNSGRIETDVDASAVLVYGEKYSEDKMGAFLKDFCGSEVKSVGEMSIWADAVLDLAARLKATGRKGERA